MVALSEEQLVRLAIERAVSVNKNASAFVQWAHRWQAGLDRSGSSARDMRAQMEVGAPPAAYLASGRAAEAALCLAEGQSVENAVQWTFQWVSLILERAGKAN